MSGLGLALRSIWDIGPELQRGELKIVLPEYRGSDAVAIYAVYPCRDFMPTKVNALIDFLSDLYGSEPYWDKAYEAGKLATTTKQAARAENPKSTKTVVNISRAPTMTR